jgi:hypothetical protein
MTYDAFDCVTRLNVSYKTQYDHPLRGGSGIRRTAVSVKSSLVAYSYAARVSAFTVGALLILASSFLYSAVLADIVVIAYGLIAASAMPFRYN